MDIVGKIIPNPSAYQETLWVIGKKVEYIPEPFPKHQLEPYGWHDILATLDVCANVHEDAIYCDEEGYDIRSIYMVSIIQEPEKSVIESSSYDEEIILEGPEMDSSRVNHSIEPTTSQGIPLME